MCRVGR